MVQTDMAIEQFHYKKPPELAKTTMTNQNKPPWTSKNSQLQNTPCTKTTTLSPPLIGYICSFLPLVSKSLWNLSFFWSSNRTRENAQEPHLRNLSLMKCWLRMGEYVFWRRKNIGLLILNVKVCFNIGRCHESITWPSKRHISCHVG